MATTASTSTEVVNRRALNIQHMRLNFTRILTFLLTACFVASAVTAEAEYQYGDERYLCDLVRFVDSKETQAIITGVQPGVTLSGDIRLPEEITVEGTTYEVVGIGMSNYTTHAGEPAAIRDNDLITSISIPKAYRMIGKMEFIGCHNIESYSVDEGNTDFMAENGILYEDLGFYDDGPTWQLLRYPSARRSATFVIPVTAKYVGPGAFAANDHIARIYLYGQQELRHGWQIGNKSIESIDCAASEYYREYESGVIFMQGSFYCVCPGMVRASYTVPMKTRYISGGAFCNSSIRQVIFPESCQTTLSEYTFAFSDIENIIFEGTPPFSASDCCFLHCKALESVTFSPAEVDGHLSFGMSAFEGCSALKEIIFLPGVTTLQIRKSAFAGCSSLTELPLSTSMQIPLLAEKAFDGCSSLSNFPFRIISEMEDGGYQFRATALTQVSWPNALKRIPRGCFSDCTALRKITLRATTRMLMQESFAGSGLQAISMMGVTDYFSSAFDDCASLLRVCFPLLPDIVPYYNHIPFTPGEHQVIVNNPALSRLDNQQPIDDADIDLYISSTSARLDLGSAWRNIYVPGGTLEVYEAVTTLPVAEMYSYSTVKEESSVRVVPLIPDIKITGVTIEGMEATLTGDTWHADVAPAEGRRMNVTVSYKAFNNPMQTTYEYPAEDIDTGIAGISTDEIRILSHTSGSVTLSREAAWQILSTDGHTVAIGRSATIDLTALPSGIYIICIPTSPAASLRIIR